MWNITNINVRKYTNGVVDIKQRRWIVEYRLCKVNMSKTHKYEHWEVGKHFH